MLAALTDLKMWREVRLVWSQVQNNLYLHNMSWLSISENVTPLYVDKNKLAVKLIDMTVESNDKLEIEKVIAASLSTIGFNKFNVELYFI